MRKRRVWLRRKRRGWRRGWRSKTGGLEKKSLEEEQQEDKWERIIGTEKFQEN